MDKPTLILGIIFTICIFGPIIYLVWSGKRRQSSAKEALLKLAGKHQGQLTRQEVINDKAIGIDSTTRRLFYVNRQLTNQQEQVVDLTYAGSCKVPTATDTVKLIIELNKTNRTQQIEVVIFDEKYDDPIDGKYFHQIAQKWAQIIDGSIEQKPVVSRSKSKRLPKAS